MQLHQIQGADEKDLNRKKFNIGIGISLGNKWFTPENVLELTKWCLQYTKDHVIVYVADSIHAVNLEVRNRMTPERAARVADQKGDQILKEVKEHIDKNLDSEGLKKIYYAKWKDIVDESYVSKTKFLYSLYESAGQFQDKIHDLIKGFVSKEDRQFSEDEIHRLGTYLIEEMPEVLARVPIKNLGCDASAYPFDGPLPIFLENIQKGIVFPEIREKVMDTEPKILLVVR